MDGKTIIKKKYAKLVLKLESSLSVGSGENNNTDKDIIRNSEGNPYIPASAIAGVVKDYFENNRDKSYYSGYLGDISKNNGDGSETETVESKVIFYDAELSDKEYHVTVRDSVALDDYKTAIKGAKFDMETLEPGVSFVTYVEQDFYSEADTDFVDEIIRVFCNSLVKFGGKSMRGYGEVSLEKAWVRGFLFKDISEKEVADWLDFSVYDENCWSESDSCDLKKYEVSDTTSNMITLELRQKGGISIRKYTTGVSESGTLPDFEQLTLNGSKEPVIPGTSWAGAIRHRMKEFGIKVDGQGSLFGYVAGEGKDDKDRSAIWFSETCLKGATPKVLSRNAIDRFTGGTKDGALFTETTYYGGQGTLKIGLSRKGGRSEEEASALAAALADLHHGFLAVGGETSIGRGLFEINSIDGEKVASDSEVYPLLFAKIKGVFGIE